MTEIAKEIEFISMGTITREQLAAYAVASGDHNPIHQDDAVAQAAGLPGVIAHGMLTAAFLGERALRFAREKATGSWRVSRFNSRFKSMTFPGDTVHVGGTLKSQSDQELTLDLQAKNQKGEVTTSGQITLVRSA